MPVPERRRVKHYRGDDFRFSFRLDQYVDPDDTSLGTTPVDLTGWTARVETDPDATNDGNTPIGMTASTPNSTGVITVDMPLESTTDPAVEVIEFDVALIDPTGFERTYIHVIITLMEQVA